MRTSRMFLVAVTAGWAAIAAGPAIADEAFPRPPRQEEPWEPPHSALPAAMIDAARVLFAQGLADPRGCAYREVELADEVGAYLSVNPQPPTVHAWVIPFEATGGPRYAVAWNGLVYRASKLGPAADLEADIDALLRPPAPPARGVIPPAPHWLIWDPMRGGQAHAHLDTARQGDLAPTKVVMLLRLGRADLAERVWKAGPGWQSVLDAKNQPQVPDLYGNLAADWQWALLDRAASAHARRDDPTALATLRELTRIKPLIDARGIARPPAVPGMANDSGFLVQLPQFLADQERRARAPRRMPASRSSFVGQTARIAGWIRDLDEECANPWTWPGTYSVSARQALIREKDAAIGPLLDCLERDDRLSRTIVRDDRHRSRYVHVVSVDGPAFEALVAILGTREFGPESRYYNEQVDRAKRKAVADEIRAYREKNRGLAPLERLFRTLADDEATSDQWLAAADALAQPGDPRGRGGEYVNRLMYGGRVPPPRGEPLRGRANLSITELMARRTREIDAREDRPGWLYGVSKANRMAGFLAEWDPKGALPTLRERVARTADVIRQARENDNALYGMDVQIARFTMLRVQAGDAAALDDYAAWIRTAPPPNGSAFYEPERYEPLWTYPDHPAIAAASVALFPPGRAGWDWPGLTSDFLISPMLGVAPFRKQVVLAGLADDRPEGEVRCDAAGKVTIVIDKSLSQLPVFRDDEPHQPRPGTTMPLRVSDHYAWKLRELPGFAWIELHWPKELRDRAIAEDVALLTRYGERFRTTDLSRALYEKAPFYPRRMRAIPVFQPLDRPATPDDVSAGRAIFAAPPGTEARRWPMPSSPMQGRWLEIDLPPGDPFLRQFDRTPPKHSWQLEYAQRGLVWQAEEVREGGRWRRYYGFVGPHQVVRVPAEEMDFPAEWNTGWSVISPDLDARLIPPGGQSIPTESASPDGPLPIVLTLRNHRGIDRTIPIDLARAVGRPALRDGVTIHLARQPEPVPPLRVAGFPRNAPPPPRRYGQQMQTGPPPEAWPELAARREPERYRSEATRTLGPTETAEVLRLDLRDFFDLERPGQYVVAVELPGIEDGAGKPARASATFEVK